MNWRNISGNPIMGRSKILTERKPLGEAGDASMRMGSLGLANLLNDHRVNIADNRSDPDQVSVTDSILQVDSS
jgi:hypothetical protein